MSNLARLFFSIVILTSLVLGSWFLIPAKAAPTFQQGTTQSPLWRYLDTSGNGTGTKIATGTYTSTRFYIQPPAANTYALSRLIAIIEDSAVVTPTLYGAATITNGVVIRRVSGSSIITLTDSISLTANAHWRRFCEVTQTSLSGVTNQLQAICNFALPVRLSGDRNERLEVLLQDDFSGLDAHYFIAEGYKE